MSTPRSGELAPWRGAQGKNLALVGVNHRSAPVHIRERLAFQEAKLGEALGALSLREGLLEAAILSTCNRTEVYAITTEVERGFQEIKTFLQEFHSVKEEELLPYLYCYSGRVAALHLLRVAAGLDSMILGEGQILAQVKHCHQAALEQGSSRKLLNSLFRSALRAGKRVRRLTGISRGPVSVSQAAVELAKRIMGGLKGHSVLVLGAGKMARLTLQALAQSRVGDIWIWNRTHTRALTLAANFTGRALPSDGLEEGMGRVDLVIACTAAPEPVVTGDMARRALERRNGDPLHLIDIGMPRNIDPALRRDPHLFLYDIDDLRDITLGTLSERKRKAAMAEDILEEEASRLMGWTRSLKALPIIAELEGHAGEVSRRELDRLYAKLASLDAAEKKALEATVRRILGKVLHHPLLWIKGCAAAGDTPCPQLEAMSKAVQAARQGKRISSPAYRLRRME